MKKFLITILVLIIAMLSIACDDGTFICQECGKCIEFDYETDEDDSGNSHDYRAYTCKDCSYEQGYIDGYNYLVDLLESGGFKNPERVKNIDDIPLPRTEDGEIDWEGIKEQKINEFRENYEKNLNE